MSFDDYAEDWRRISDAAAANPFVHRLRSAQWAAGDVVSNGFVFDDGPLGAFRPTTVSTEGEKKIYRYDDGPGGWVLDPYTGKREEFDVEAEARDVLPERRLLAP